MNPNVLLTIANPGILPLAVDSGDGDVSGGLIFILFLPLIVLSSIITVCVIDHTIKGPVIFTQSKYIGNISSVRNCYHWGKGGKYTACDVQTSGGFLFQASDLENWPGGYAYVGDAIYIETRQFRDRKEFYRCSLTKCRYTTTERIK